MIPNIYNNIQVDAAGKVIAGGNQDYALSKENGQISYLDIATGTIVTIALAGDGTTNYVRINLTTTLSADTNFDNGGTNDGTLRYIGARTGYYYINAAISYEPTITGDKFIFAIAKNGTKDDSSKIINDVALTGNTNSVSLTCIMELTLNDTVDIYVSNIVNANSLTVYSFNLNIHG